MTYPVNQDIQFSNNWGPSSYFSSQNVDTPVIFYLCRKRFLFKLPAHSENGMCSHPGILCGTKFLRILIFAVSSMICKKIYAKKFPAKIYSTVDILMVDIDYGIESDSEDEE